MDVNTRRTVCMAGFSKASGAQPARQKSHPLRDLGNPEEGGFFALIFPSGWTEGARRARRNFAIYEVRE
jgi:hypothetical protein